MNIVCCSRDYGLMEGGFCDSLFASLGKRTLQQNDSFSYTKKMSLEEERLFPF